MKLQFKSIQVLVLVLISFFLGLSAQKYFSKEVSQAETSSDSECDSLKSKLSDVSAEEIKEYLRTQNADEKLKKADEILAKIVMALIADIGLRIEKNDLDLFGKAIPEPESRPTEIKTYTKTSTPTAEPSPAQVAKKNSVKEVINPAASEEQARKAVDAIQSHFSERLQLSHNVNGAELSALNGNFEGVLFRENLGGPHRVVFSFQGRMRGNNSSGKYFLQIFYPSGKSMSTIKSSSNLDRFSESDKSVFIDVNGNYLEIIYFPNLDSWYGQYLESQKGVLQKTGVVSLKRIH